ncbi:MAG: DUF2254 domain-containing protein [Bacteroidia bacterium]
MKKLLFRLRELLATFWFVPLVITAFGMILALALLWADRSFDIQPEGLLRLFFSKDADSVRAVLSTISGAMIGVAGTVFSITLVVLTMASSQFGPRLLRNFMYKRINQVVLGSYIATYIYSLIVLSAVRSTEQFDFIPGISVLGALLLALLNLVLLIVFIHDVSMSIQSDRVIDELRKVLEKSIGTLHPEESGNESIHGRALADWLEVKDKLPLNRHYEAPQSGYLQLADLERLLTIAEENHLLVEVHQKPGDYLVKSERMLSLFQYPSTEPKNLSDETLNALFLFANNRSYFQDSEFAIHQIVEVASRALSPGVNDPYTAINCIDNLTSVLCRIAGSAFPQTLRFDEKQQLRMITKTDTFEGFVNASFNQIRQYGASSPSVMIRLMEALAKIMSFTRNGAKQAVIIHHAEMVMEVSKQSFDSQSDLQDLESRFL